MSRGKSVGFTKAQRKSVVEFFHQWGYELAGVRKDERGETILVRKAGESNESANGVAASLSEWDEILDGEDRAETHKQLL